LDNSLLRLHIKSVFSKKYKNPNKISGKNRNRGFYPDIQTTFPDGVTNIYQIVLSEKINKTKWRLFSEYTQKRKGRLYVIAPKDILKKGKRLIQKDDLNNIELIAITA
jgi:hypothetical protein